MRWRLLLVTLLVLAASALVFQLLRPNGDSPNRDSPNGGVSSVTEDRARPEIDADPKAVLAGQGAFSKAEWDLYTYVNSDGDECWKIVETGADRSAITPYCRTRVLDPSLGALLYLRSQYGSYLLVGTTSSSVTELEIVGASGTVRVPTLKPLNSEDNTYRVAVAESDSPIVEVHLIGDSGTVLERRNAESYGL